MASRNLRGVAPGSHVLAGALLAAALAVLRHVTCFAGFSAPRRRLDRASLARGFFSTPLPEVDLLQEEPRSKQALDESPSPSPGLSVGASLEILYQEDGKWYPAVVVEPGTRPLVRFQKEGYEYHTTATTYRATPSLDLEPLQRIANPGVTAESSSVQRGGAARPAAAAHSKSPELGKPSIATEGRYGTVVSVHDGIKAAFVDIGEGQDCFVHISKMAEHFVSRVSDVVAVGDRVRVWADGHRNGKPSCTMIDPQGASAHGVDLEVGQEITGVVKAIPANAGGAFVDIGLDVDGFLHVSDMSKEWIKTPHEVVTVGQTVDLIVKRVTGNRVGVSLSSKNAPDGGSGDAERTPATIGEDRYATVLTVNDDDGIFVDIGADEDCFVPVRQMAVSFVEAAGDFVSKGDRVRVWVTDIQDGRPIGTMVNPSRISIRDADLSVGQTLQGVVRKVSDEVYGAFVDIGFLEEAFLHVSKMAVGFVEHPSDVLTVGQNVNVAIDSIRGDRVKLSLLPELEEAIESGRLTIGMQVTGKVKRASKISNCAYVDIGYSKDAVLHASKVARAFVADITEVLSAGQRVTVWIHDVGPEGSVQLRLFPPQSVEEIEYGQQYLGVVTSISEDHGLAFIDVGAASQGTLHINQLRDFFGDRGKRVSSYAPIGKNLRVAREDAPGSSHVKFTLQGLPGLGFHGLASGDELSGTVISVVDPHMAFLDIGTGKNAVLYREDMESEPDVMSELLSEGQVLSVYVKRLDVKKQDVFLTASREKGHRFVASRLRG
eukprot:TRINITY_DN21882_c1_g1_i1.p1 TRINITY_DN21882_c1_g1~~TRINITY_DN21882_c1_g1_i1.p1  ORF type:complete len:784 (+),score=118.08 TRINITY_DN21882_c1_g1_i1:34-2352(+)